jgi:hypothetical protein
VSQKKRRKPVPARMNLGELFMLGVGIRPFLDKGAKETIQPYGVGLVDQCHKII